MQMEQEVGMVNRRWQNALFVTLVQNDLKYTEASFLPISADSFTLQVAQVPRLPKLAIFVPTTTDYP